MSLKGQLTTTSFLEWSEFVHLVTRLESRGKHRLALYAYVATFTGLRASDVLQLTWGQLEGACLDGRIGVTEQKTGKRREIKVAGDLCEAVRRIRKAMGSPVAHQLAFVNRYGNKAIDIGVLNEELRSAFTELKVKYRGNVSTHLFRKTFGRRVWDLNGRSDEALVLLGEVFGHSSVALTRRYLGIRQEHIDDVYASLSL